MKTTPTGRCPCNGECCEEPDTYCPKHTCQNEDFCEDCFFTVCKNCESECCCDL